jgi:hypothetical protein
MIGHEAIAPDLSTGLLCRFIQQIFVKRLVALFKEGLRTPVAALGHVLRVTGNNKTG